MSHYLHRSLRSAIPTVVRGEGCYLFDETGKRYFDGSGGAAVACLGHAHPTIIAAMERQLRLISFAHTSFFTNRPSEALADFMIARAPQDMSRFVAVSDGSVAVEVALKLQRQYWIERGEPNRQIVIARHQSYHGNTLGALSVSGNRLRREPYAPLLTTNARHIEPCYAYRHQAPGESLAQYGIRAAGCLREAIEQFGPDNVAAFIAEPVVGATLGCATAAPGYFRLIREICDEFGVLFIADEIMCGMGRTGTLFASKQEGVVPDIIAVAKGLGGGYQPIGGVLAHSKVVDVIERGTGSLANGHTYMGHPIAAAAALAVQQVIEEDDLLQNVRSLGTLLETMLRAQFAGHPYVGDIRGRGLFWALELVRDRDTKAPFDPGARLHERVKKQAMANGLVCYPSGGTVDGERGDHVLFAPPYIATEAQLRQMVAIAAVSIDSAISSLEQAGQVVIE